jgi:4-azaleucine resistance transporter AzlC
LQADESTQGLQPSSKLQTPPARPSSPSAIWLAFKTAFPYTIPIFAGFWFLGLTYGIYMNVSGFSFLYPLCMSIVIFGGSLEFVAVSMLLSTFAPLQTFLAALMIQARHLFYGIAMLDKFKGTGWKKPYLIYGMCDETFSINCSVTIPEGVDKGWFMFFVTLLNQLYWVSGSTLGGILGSFLTFNTEGLDFVMTAMFVVIFLEQCLKETRHYTAIIGVAASVLCLVLFGADSFLIPTMVCILALLTVLRRPIEKAGGFA